MRLRRIIVLIFCYHAALGRRRRPSIGLHESAQRRSGHVHVRERVTALHPNVSPWGSCCRSSAAAPSVTPVKGLGVSRGSQGLAGVLPAVGEEGVLGLRLPCVLGQRGRHCSCSCRAHAYIPAQATLRRAADARHAAAAQRLRLRFPTASLRSPAGSCA